MTSRIRLFVLPLLLLALLVSACSKSPAPGDSSSDGKSGARPAIVFMTDFGAANDAVAICKAVILGIAPDARIMDITHQVTPYQNEEASRFLYGVTPYYPSGTVFLVVVDTGSETSSKAAIAKFNQWQFFGLPDNA